MQEGAHTFTKTGRMRRATYAEVCRWGVESWNAIPCQVSFEGLTKDLIDLLQNCLTVTAKKAMRNPLLNPK